MNNHIFDEQTDVAEQTDIETLYVCLKCNICLCEMCKYDLIFSFYKDWKYDDYIYNRKLIKENSFCSMSDDEYLIKNIIE